LRGNASHYLDTHQRRLLGGAIASVFGAFFSIPLVTQVLMPRRTQNVARTISSLSAPPPRTRVIYEALATRTDGGRGYTVEEMADVVEGQVRAIGLTRGFAPLVVVMGHGSASLNNPHEAAHDCGACGGGRGGPNARVFAAMANEPRVRRLLAAQRVYTGGNKIKKDRQSQKRQPRPGRQNLPDLFLRAHLQALVFSVFAIAHT